MGKVRFSTRLPVSGPVSNRDRMIETAQEAEALGYHALLGQDHIHRSVERALNNPVGAGSAHEPSNTSDPVLFESVTRLAFLAGKTETIELGIGVMPLPLREPIVLAKQLATLDALSGGRFILGVGVGNKTDKEEFGAMGVPFLSFSERYELAGEYIAAMRAIWENPTASFHGRHVNFDSLTIYPKPARRIPVWLGAGTLTGGADDPRVKFALDHADGLMPPFLTTPDDFRTMTRHFTKVAKAAGRDISDFVWCAQRRVSIALTREEAYRNVEWIAKEQPDQWKHHGYTVDHGEEGGRANLKAVTTGTPADIRVMIGEYVAAGTNHFEVSFVYRTFDAMLNQMRLFASEVLPAFS